ncbi:stage III sporulation protein AA [Paenibacillus beijingensis]|uniref:Stage III sporulation protein AA n=1 Tax=Paenibacillus beijingensis TaxID=1126833 RepID=A0A0D5NPT2_9BACL|nr:stage III sporulation protein AA [Paenibacillus beijingensis]AJY77266.1 stage III sporulation protein AA [Paenibacillus beijingensis]
MLTKVAHLLPAELTALLERMPEAAKQELEEIRIREHRPLEIVSGGRSWFAEDDGTLTAQPQLAYKPSHNLCRKLLEKLTNHSLYAMEEELKRGFITVAGGHRIGLAGRTVLEGGSVRAIRDIGGFNVRIAREVIGAADRLLPKLADRPKRNIASTLLIAPPRMGKTTLLRDLARSVSAGLWGSAEMAHWPGRKVGIVDERSEIAASVRGVPTFDVGPRTDVMDACPKAEGMMMLLRSMSPEVLMADEIGRAEDVQAIREAGHAGVAVVVTAHAHNLDDARGRPILRALLEEGMFQFAVVLSRGTGTGFLTSVIPLRGAAAGIPAAREPTARGNLAGSAAAGDKGLRGEEPGAYG